MVAEFDLETGLQLLEKESGESVLFDFKFSRILSPGDSIATVVNVTQDLRGEVAGSVPLTEEGAASHDGALTGQVRLSGGTSGEYYCLKMKVTSVRGDTRTCAGVLFVNDIC